MRIIIINNNENIVVVKDFSDLDKSKTGLMGQIVMELELLKHDILCMYIKKSNGN